ncbi:hypothetical protein SEA_GODONK_159 [Gordonia phage GodonK]|uniref:Uncharacterized protein n=1 Tax=Gordonia phage GodonK TaxID=2562192 RepID=A0A4D6E2M4_9CAUD|nr:hypothetical protein HOV33_gp202 [Gordonia phage GodonK]QBZ72754.1 hypothetical protein SEA_GODONK_159 [Gordonia phage GodonK]
MTRLLLDKATEQFVRPIVVKFGQKLSELRANVVATDVVR